MFGCTRYGPDVAQEHSWSVLPTAVAYVVQAMAVQGQLPEVGLVEVGMESFRCLDHELFRFARDEYPYNENDVVESRRNPDRRRLSVCSAVVVARRRCEDVALLEWDGDVLLQKRDSLVGTSDGVSEETLGIDRMHLLRDARDCNTAVDRDGYVIHRTDSASQQAGVQENFVPDRRRLTDDRFCPCVHDVCFCGLHPRGGCGRFSRGAVGRSYSWWLPQTS